jgi:hypothetical protein
MTPKEIEAAQVLVALKQLETATVRFEAAKEARARMAELEHELEKARKEIALLYWMRSEAMRSALEIIQLPNDENWHARALFLFDYIKYVGWHIWPEKGFKERPRLPTIEEYLAQA